MKYDDFSFLYNFLCSLNLIIVLLLCLDFYVLITNPLPDCLPVVKNFSQYIQRYQVFCGFFFWTLFSWNLLSGSILAWLPCILGPRNHHPGDSVCLLLCYIPVCWIPCLPLPWFTTLFWSSTFSRSALRKGAGKINFVRPQYCGNVFIMHLHLIDNI